MVKRVSRKTYERVMETSNNMCGLCKNQRLLQYHHIHYRSERRDLIDNHTNGIMLCMNCHMLVHKNKRKWKPLLLKIKEAQLEREMEND